MDDYGELITAIEMLYRYYLQVNAQVISAKKEFDQIKKKVNAHLR
jgi:hypothetical protein